MPCREEDLRSARLLGMRGLERLKNAHVAVFGVGGVGGYACEALARAGVGELTLVDADTVSLSNINRQIIALHSTVGRPKVEVMRERIRDINADCVVHAVQAFYLPENADDIPLDGFDYVLDAVDTVAAKVELVCRAERAGVPILSAMGAGNRLCAEGFAVTDLFATQGCPLARVMRQELRRRGIQRLSVVFSSEPVASIPDDAPIEETDGRRSPGSLSYVPGVAGLIMAGEVIRHLSGLTPRHGSSHRA